MADFEDELENERRVYRRINIERVLRATDADGELRLGRLKDVSAGGVAVHLDEPLEEGAKVTLEIEDLGSFSGRVSGPSRDGLIPIAFDNAKEDEDKLLAEIMRIHNDMTLDDE